MKFKIKSRFFGSLNLFTPLEKFKLTLDYIKTNQMKKMFHIIIEAPLKSKLINGPTSIAVEPTSFCNASCILCPTPFEKLERTINFLPMKKFKEIIDKTKCCINKVTFFVAGEPFMNKNLCKMINYASKNGMRTFVSTNGILLNQQTINELLQTNLDELHICLESSKKETHELHRRNTNFEQICSNIQTLTSEKRKRKKTFPHIFIQTLVTRYNENELEDIAALAKQLGAEGIFFKSFSIEKEHDQKLVKQFIPKKSYLSRYEIVNGKTKMRTQIDFQCEYTEKPLILCDGTIALCCYDYNGIYNIGNVFSKNIIELWNTKKYKELRKKMERKEFETCKKMCGQKKF